jgi:hypothetical protein
MCYYIPMTENRDEHQQEPLTVYIFRLEKTEHYARIANSVFEDDRLSWEARGLMGYLLSRPDDWQVRLYDLIARGPAGVHKIRRMLRELEEVGYLYRKRLRRKDGTFGWIVFVLEHPSLARSLGLELHFGTRKGQWPTYGSSTPGFSTDG